MASEDGTSVEELLTRIDADFVSIHHRDVEDILHYAPSLDVTPALYQSVLSNSSPLL